MVRDEVASFGRDVVARLLSVLGGNVVGAYFVGSIALGDYLPGQSDIDIVAVTASAVSDVEKRQVVDALTHADLRCPARGLEFVLYARPKVEAASGDGAFEINLNSGPRMVPHISFDASVEPRFWFVIDRAFAHASGIAISGPPASSVFAPIPRRILLEVLDESIAWHRANEQLSYASVLNGCRAWRYAEEGELGSKTQGADWARQRSPDRSTIETALRMRRGAAAELDEREISVILDHAQAALTAALAGTTRGSAG